jgi:sugar lactone lactonase YvrE
MTVRTPTRLVDGLVFGEGPRWREDRLWFSDMHGEAVHTIDLDGHLETVVAVTGRRPSGLGFLPDRSLLIVSMLEREILRWDGVDLTVHADLSPVVPDGLNDMVVDASGNAYVGSFPPATNPDGVLVLVRPDGATEIAARDLSFPNGSVIGDGGRSLIVAESLGRRFSRFAIADDGTLSDRTLFADIAPRGPDGICLDAEGAVWAAMTLAREFLRVAPGGEVLDSISIDDRLAIACALGGPDGRTLFLLTALEHAPDALRGTRDAAIHVVDVDVPGAGSP